MWRFFRAKRDVEVSIVDILVDPWNACFFRLNEGENTAILTVELDHQRPFSNHNSFISAVGFFFSLFSLSSSFVSWKINDLGKGKLPKKP